MKKTTKKDCFCSIYCVNGYCPHALGEEHRSRDDDIYFAYEGMERLSCRQCWYNTGLCKDCIFENNAEACPEFDKKNHDGIC